MTVVNVKKKKSPKKCVIKGNREFENYKNCIKATKLENKINLLEEKKIDAEVLTKRL